MVWDGELFGLDEVSLDACGEASEWPLLAGVELSSLVNGDEANERLIKDINYSLPALGNGGLFKESVDGPLLALGAK